MCIPVPYLKSPLPRSTFIGPQNSIRTRFGANVRVHRLWNDVVLWIRARTKYSKGLKYSMVPVNNSKPSFSSSVFICTTILVHAWPLFLNLRDLQRSRNSVKNCTLEASSVQFSVRFPGFADRLSTGFSDLFLVLGLGSIAEFHAVLRA